MGSDRTSLNRVMGEYKKLNQMGRVVKEGGEGDLNFLKGKSIKKKLTKKYKYIVNILIKIFKKDTTPFNLLTKSNLHTLSDINDWWSI